MIPRSVSRKKALQLYSLQEGKLLPLLFQVCNRSGQRWLCGSAADLEVVHDILSQINKTQEQISPVHARARQRPQATNRRKPVSLPLADFSVEVEQLVAVVRRKSSSADLDKCLDALYIRINPFHVAQTLSTIDDAESAIHFFSWAAQQPGYSHNLYTCMTLVTILARAREFDKIWELVSEMNASGFQLTDACFNVTIKAYGEMGNHSEAIRTLHKMQEFEVLPTAYSYNTLLSVLLKFQKLDLAKEIYHEMMQAPHIEQDVFSHSMMVSALCNAGRLEEAHKVVTDMAERGHSINAVTWTTLINGFCKTGNVKQAIELFSLMKDTGLEPTVVTYSAIIGGFCKAGKLSDAMTYLERMKSDGFEPNAITYTPLLDAFCKAGRIDEGFELLKKAFTDCGRGNAILYCIIVSAYSQSERMDEACAMYDEMVKDGCWPNTPTYAVLIQGLCKTGRMNEALRFFNEMRERKCGPNAAVYKVMVEGLSKAGFKEEAEKMFQEMLAEGYECSVTTFKELLNCLYEVGSQDTAKEILKMMLKKNCEVRASTFRMFLKALCDATQVDSAYAFFKEMLKCGIAPSAEIYNILIHGAFKAGDLKKALELSSEMQSKGFDRNLYTYAALYQVAWKAKRSDVLLDIYDDMRIQHVHVNPFVFSLLMKALCAMNKVPKACDVCSQIFEDGFESSDTNEQGSRLDMKSFLKIEVFLPLLFHLQDSGNVKEMVSIWDSILQEGLFSWYEHSGIDSLETLQ